MNIAHWLRQTLTVASLSSVDGYGSPAYGAQRSVAACIEQKADRVLNERGEEVIVSHRIFVGEELQLTDRLWLPGTDTGSADAARRPARIEANPDRSGSVPFWVVYL